MNIATRIGRILKYNNARCVAPPGTVFPAPGRPIIIATLMRSGTHLLIDSLLNNSRVLRKSPLYIDFDEYISQNSDKSEENLLQDFVNGGSRIIKTHYPQLGGGSTGANKIVSALSKSSFIITVSRDLDDISSSMQRFTKSKDIENFAEIHSDFEKFWASRRSLNLDFNDLVGQWEASIRRIFECIDIPPDGRLKPPPGKDQRYSAYTSKFLTRLLGRRAPTINTTIGFNLKP